MKHSTNGIHLSQANYIIDLLCKAKILHAKLLSTLMINGLQLFRFNSVSIVRIKPLKA